jgi:hypothetical protein
MDDDIYDPEPCHWKKSEKAFVCSYCYRRRDKGTLYTTVSGHVVCQYCNPEEEL